MGPVEELPGEGRAPLEEGELLAPALIHEMRQPLTAVRAGLELVSRRLGAQLVSLGDWSMIGAQLDRLEELFRAYQDFLHPERRTPVPFAPGAVVRKAITLLHHRIRRLGPRFAFDPGDPCCQGLGVPNGLLHATTNVLANALDALDATDLQGRLEVRLIPVADAPALEVRISDGGPGIPAELRGRIFEPRFTTKPNGSGLGLHIAHRMLSSFGGSIRLVEEGDAGRLAWARTEFVLRVPCPERPES